MPDPYHGPAAVVISHTEAEELLQLLIANPRTWNAELRGRLIAYLDWPQPSRPGDE